MKYLIMYLLLYSSKISGMEERSLSQIYEQLINQELLKIDTLTNLFDKDKDNRTDLFSCVVHSFETIASLLQCQHKLMRQTIEDKT